MTKRIVRLAVVAAAASSVVLPATSANAACSWTFPRQCVEELLHSVAVQQPDVPCVPYGTFEICLPPASA